MGMRDYLRESFSYFGLFRRMKRYPKYVTPEYQSFGPDKDQYFLYFEPSKTTSNKVIFWIHGGGWNAGNPKDFDYVGQSISNEGYRVVSFGYRLSPKNKYPVQIEDVAAGYNAAVEYLQKKNVDTSEIVVVGPSAGAHLSSILCYSDKAQKDYNVDISHVIGYVGFGGPYSFRPDQTKTMSILLNQVMPKGYDRKQAEPVSLLSKNHIPALLIQSRHDGIVEYECAEDFKKRADELGNICELYSVVGERNTHSWYTAGLFFLTRHENKDLDKFYSWIEAL